MHPIVYVFIGYAAGAISYMILFAWAYKEIHYKNKEPSWRIKRRHLRLAR